MVAPEGPLDLDRVHGLGLQRLQDVHVHESGTNGIVSLHRELERTVHWKDGKRPRAVAGKPTRCGSR